MVQDFRKVKVWEKAHELTLGIYRATTSFPDNERYGIVSQIRRACASIPTNIAEGCGRSSQNDLARFIDIATGSANEVDYQLQLAMDLGYLGETHYISLTEKVEEVRRMLTAFNKTVRYKSSSIKSEI
ncbi:MAG: four helix bundle protein [Pirellulales bacterium]|nr:four helix bundle protein [Pirellulales bacterium]